MSQKPKSFIIVFTPDAGSAAAAVFHEVRTQSGDDVPIRDSSEYQHLEAVGRLKQVIEYLFRRHSLQYNRHYYFARCTGTSSAGAGMSC